jgi:hypothetical protein
MNPLYELEQPLLQAATMPDDLRLLVKVNAAPEEYLALATVYDIKFTHLWDLFEEVLRTKKEKPSV